MSIQSVGASAALDMGTMARTAATPATANSGNAPPVQASGQSPATAENAGSTNAVGKVNRADATSSAQEPDRDTLMQAVEEVRKAIEPVAQDLLFSIDDDTGRTVVKVVDSSTDEVIRQIPSKEVLAIAQALDKLQGVLIRQDA